MATDKGIDNLRALLREGDPMAREGGLSPDAAETIRRTALAAVTVRQNAGSTWWPGPLFMAATVAATLVAGVALARRLPVRDAGVDRRAAAPSAVLAAESRRQLQFATPGGTRIIWVFDPQFNP